MVMMVMMIMVMMMVVIVMMVVIMVMIMTMLVDVVVVMSTAQGHIMAVLFFTADGDIHVGAGDAAGHSLAGLDLHAGEQAVHCFQKSHLFEFGHQFVQCRHQHIASSAHVAFQI